VIGPQIQTARLAGVSVNLRGRWARCDDSAGARWKGGAPESQSAPGKRPTFNLQPATCACNRQVLELSIRNVRRPRLDGVSLPKAS